MELKTVIQERRSVRHYNNKDISRETLEDILECAHLAPSAHNRQPWNFIVIHSDKELKEKIATMLLEKGEPSMSMTSNVIKESAALILVFATITDTIMDVQSVGAALENICLRARDLDVGTLWIGYILKIEEELKEIFNREDKLIAAVALGYTDKFPSPRPRKLLEDVTLWY